MNVLLLFAFIASCFSVIKDFLDTDLMWANKNIFSIILAILAFIPLCFNLFIFYYSDRFCLKEVLIQFLKFSLMDGFEDFMSQLCILEKGIYCNQSSFYATEHSGGRMLSIMANFDNPLNYEKFLVEDVLNDLDFCKSGILLEITDLSKCYNLVPNFELINDSNGLNTVLDYLDLLITCTNLNIKKVFIQNEGTLIETEFFNFSVSSKRQYIRYQNEKIIFSIDSTYFPERDDLLKTTHLSFPCKLKDFVKIKKGCINFNYGIKIGILNLVFKDDKIYSFYKDKVLRVYNLNFSSDIKKMLRLNYLLYFWSKENCKGIWNGAGVYNTRAGTNIGHCLKISEIIDHCDRNCEIVQALFASGKYRMEGLSFFDNKQSEVCCHLLGEKKTKTLVKLILNYFKEEYLGEVLFDAMNLRSGIHFYRNKYEGLTNHKKKMFLSDLNYFFELIGYGGITGHDKNVFPSRFAASCCRDNEKIKDPFKKEAASLDKVCGNKNVLKKLTDLKDSNSKISKSSQMSIQVETDIAQNKKLNKLYSNCYKNSEVCKTIEKQGCMIKQRVSNSYKSVLLNTISNIEKHGVQGVAIEDVVLSAILKTTTNLKHKNKTKKGEVREGKLNRTRKHNKKPVLEEQPNLRKEKVNIQNADCGFWIKFVGNRKTRKIFDLLSNPDPKGKIGNSNYFSVLNNVIEDDEKAIIPGFKKVFSAVQTIKEEEKKKIAIKKELENKKQREAEQKKKLILDKANETALKKERAEKKKDLALPNNYQIIADDLKLKIKPRKLYHDLCNNHLPVLNKSNLNRVKLVKRIEIKKYEGLDLKYAEEFFHNCNEYFVKNKKFLN